MDKNNLDKNKDLLQGNEEKNEMDKKSSSLGSSFKDKILKFEYNLPHILEIHNDNIRNRVLFILGAILVYCFATFLIFNMDVKNSQVPVNIVQENKIPKNILIGKTFENYGSHHISLKDNQGAKIPYQKTQLYINSINQIKDNSVIDCSDESMESRLFTLEQLRYYQVCRVDFQGGSIISSDKTGFAVMKGTKIQRGPTGVYSIAFTTPNYYTNFINNNYSYDLEDISERRRILQTSANETDSMTRDFNFIEIKNKELFSKKIMSSSETMLVESEVASIEILNLNLIQNTVEIGKPFQPAPIIKITDMKGNPLINKTVVVFSSNTYIYGKNVDYDIKANKFALLKNNLSPPTDANGTTILNGLTVIGANYPKIFLLLYCEGITSSWYYSIKRNIFSFLNYYVPPTNLLTNVSKVSVYAPQISITEGEFFNNPPVIKVTDKDNNPLVGKVVFAEVIKVGTKKSKYGMYLNEKFTSIKRLKFPVNGEYYLNSNDLYPDFDTFSNPELTNSKGEIVFKNLLFDIMGFSGKSLQNKSNFTVTLIFVCDGVVSNEVIINVNSKTYFSLIYSPSNRIILKDSEPHFINAAFQSYDINFKEIYGKMPEDYFLRDEFFNKMTATVVPYYNSNIQPTNPFGYVDLFISNIGNLTLNKSYHLCLTIDNIEECNLNGLTEIVSDDQSVYHQSCSFINIQLQTKSGKNELNINESFNITGNITNILNEKVTSENLYLNIYPDMQLLGSLRKDLYTISGQKSINIDVLNNGTFSIRNLEVSRGLAGTIYFVVSNVEDYGLRNSTYTKCASNFVEAEIIEEVDKIVVLNTLNQTNKTILNEYNKTFTLNLQLFKNNKVLSNKTFQIQMEIIHKSVSFFNENNYVPLKMNEINQKYTTNTQGIVSIDVTQNFFNFGRMSFQVFIGGFLSEPIDFFVNRPKDLSISIVKQPSTLNQTSYKIWSGLPQSAEVKVTIGGVPVPDVIVYDVVRGLNGVKGTTTGFFPSKNIDDPDANQIRIEDAISYFPYRTNSEGIASIGTFFSDINSNSGIFKVMYAVGEPPFNIVTEYSNPIMVTKRQNTFLSIEPQYKYSLSPIINMPFSNIIHTSITFSRIDYPNLAIIFLYVMPFEISRKQYDNDVLKTFEMDKNFLEGNICIIFKLEENISGTGCSFVKREDSKDTIKLIFNWSSLIWKFPLVENDFRLCVIGPFDNPSSSLVNSRTDMLKLMTEPQLIKINNDDIPDVVNVDDFFSVYYDLMIDVETKSKGGNIKCSVISHKINPEALSKKFINGGVRVTDLIEQSNKMTNLVINGNRENIFTSTASKSGSGILYININSGMPGIYCIVCWTMTNKGIGYSKNFRLENKVFNTSIVSKISSNYFKIFKFKANNYLTSQINLGDLYLDVKNSKNENINDINSGDIILKISPYSTMVEYADRIMPKLVNKILDIGLNFFVGSLSDMFVIVSNFTRVVNNTSFNVSDFEKIPQEFFILGENEKNMLKNYNMDQLNDFILNRFGIKLNFNIQYLSTLVENLVNNEKINSGDPQVLISKVINLFLEQTASIDNPLKLPSFNTIQASGLKCEYISDKMQYKLYDYTFPIKPGKYFMVVTVKGIESKRTKVFSVQASVLSRFSELDFVLVSLVCFLTFAMMPKSNWKWISFLTLISLILAIIFHSINPNNFIWFLTGLIVYSLITVAVIWEIIRGFCSKGNEHNYLYFQKQEVFMEYTYQRIFNQPSKYWIDKIKSENKHLKRIEENQKLPGNEDELMDIIYKSNKERFPPINSLPLIEKNINVNTSSEIFKETHSEFYDSKEFENVSSDTNSHINIEFKEKFKRIFSPFSLYLESNCVLNDCIYFPSRLILSLVIGVITAGYITYTIVNFCLKLDDSFTAFISKIKGKFLLDSIASDNTMQMSHTSVSSTSGAVYIKQNIVSLIDYFQSNTDSFITGFKIGTLIAVILLFIIYIVNIYIILSNFKTRVLLLRRNNPDFNVKKSGLSTSLSFVGNFIANSLLSFITLEFILSIILAILFTPIFWTILFQFITVALITMLAMIIVKQLVMLIVKKLCISDKYIRFPRIFGYLELYLLFTNMYVGLVTAFMRLIMLILVLLFAIFRIDQTAVPQWVYNVLNMDAINNAFLGNVYMYHCHNHPINVTFKLYMENFSKNLRSLTQEKYDLPKKNFEEKSIFYLNLIKKRNYLRDKIQMARLLSMDKDKEMLLKDARVKAILKKKMEEELKGKEIKKTENNSKLEENVKENENKYL